jgi:hypothetical protein
VKTTAKVLERLFADAGAMAKRQGTTLRQMIDDRRAAIAQYRGRSPRFHLRDGSFSGEGPKPKLGWSEIKRMIYEGRAE